jgi:hypothetical protein
MPVTVRLAWPANPAAQAVSSYQVWESKDGAPFTLKSTVTLPTLDILNPLPGVYRWFQKALNFVGISADSPIAEGPSIPTAPEIATVTVIQS